MIYINIILFVIGFALLIKGADFLVKGSSSLARKLGVSDFIIGLTIVAIGTSAPELVISLISGAEDKSSLLLGNLLGSNIANLLLILGTCALISPLIIKKTTVWREIPLMMFSACLAVLLMTNLNGGGASSFVSFNDALILISFFAFFMYYVFSITKREKNVVVPETKKYNIFISLIFIVLGLAALILGANWIVDGASYIALLFNLKESFIGLTIVALGTSLPELATSLVAVYHKRQDIAISNVIGSNIFNLSLILGAPALMNPIKFSSSLNLSIIVVLMATALFFVFMFVGRNKVLQRWQGGIFIIFYLIYLSLLTLR